MPKAVTTVQDALLAADEVGYPVVVKPNVGGSGAGIVRFDTPQALQAAASAPPASFRSTPSLPPSQE